MNTNQRDSRVAAPRPSQSRHWSRRDFLAAGFAAPLVVPRHVVGRTASRRAPSDTLSIAAVGIGGVGRSYIAGCAHEHIVALVDVDDALAAPVFEGYPAANRYRDYRVMLDREPDVDAVIVGTPDHTHAVITLEAIARGKHVYVAKPMTRTIGELQRVVDAAADAGVATQMSVQSCASDEACRTAEWIRAGAVGLVREVHVWTDRPVWPQGIARPGDTPPVPAHLDWNLWLGPAPERPYHPAYHPFDFRGWYDFGTGALGDMACHAFHVFYRELQLERPAGVSGAVTRARIPALDGTADPSWSRSKPMDGSETFPPSSIVTWDFPARGALPPLRMYWYDGGLRPAVPAGLAVADLMAPDGLLFVGEKGALLSGFTGGPMKLSAGLAETFEEPEPTLPRSPGHYLEWTEACKGGPEANCHFGFGGRITELALLGVAAQRTNAYLEWDSDQKRFTNSDDANDLLDPPERTGW